MFDCKNEPCNALQYERESREDLKSLVMEIRQDQKMMIDMIHDLRMSNYGMKVKMGIISAGIALAATVIIEVVSSMMTKKIGG